jgi:hypothetical protein
MAMTTPAALSDRTHIYRHMIRIVYADRRAMLHRLKARLEEAGPAAPALADLTARGVSYLRDLVNALGQPRVGTIERLGSTVMLRPDEAPILAPEIFKAMTATLDTIDQQVQHDPTTACLRCIDLLDLIGREVAWLGRV